MIKEFSICEIIDEIRKGDNTPLLWEDENRIILEFCKNHNYFLYERPRDEFFKWEGYELAVNAGCDGIIYSDLS